MGDSVVEYTHDEQDNESARPYYVNPRHSILRVVFALRIAAVGQIGNAQIANSPRYGLDKAQGARRAPIMKVGGICISAKSAPYKSRGVLY